MRTAWGLGQLVILANALASSIILVCRKRPTDVADCHVLGEFVAALKRELPAALRDLQRGNIAPVDLAQASIGPGMAIYSRYRRVLEADGSACTSARRWRSSTRRSTRTWPSRKGNTTLTPAGRWPGSSSSASRKALLATPRLSPKPKTPTLAAWSKPASWPSQRGQGPPAPPRGVAGRLGSRHGSPPDRLGGHAAAHPHDAGAGVSRPQLRSWRRSAA